MGGGKLLEEKWGEVKRVEDKFKIGRQASGDNQTRLEDKQVEIIKQKRNKWKTNEQKITSIIVFPIT